MPGAPEKKARVEDTMRALEEPLPRIAGGALSPDGEMY